MNKYKTFTSFSVDDLEKAKSFYSDKVGLEVKVHADHNVLLCSTGGDTRFMAYVKEDHEAAGFTVLNFDVDHIESVVDGLASNGVKFEQVEGTNEKGIAEMGSTKAAWFRDPAGNWVGLFEENS